MFLTSEGFGEIFGGGGDASLLAGEGADTLSGGAGQLATKVVAGGLLLQGSTDGDTAAEFELFLDGVTAVGKADMLL